MFRDVLGLLVARLSVNRNFDLCGQLFQLFKRARTVSVGPDNAHPQSSLLEEPCQFHRTGRFPRALDPDQHEFAECSRLDLDLGGVLADKPGHFLVNNLDDMFSPRYSGWKLLLERTILDGL